MRLTEIYLAALLSVFISTPLSAEELQIGGGATFNAAAPPPVSLLERNALTGDWGGLRTQLQENGITIAPRLTQFYQGMTAGDGDHDFQYGGKFDVMLSADLSRLGFWDGLSLRKV